jgi:hypothetical protein
LPGGLQLALQNIDLLVALPKQLQQLPSIQIIVVIRISRTALFAIAFIARALLVTVPTHLYRRRGLKRQGRGRPMSIFTVRIAVDDNNRRSGSGRPSRTEAVHKCSPCKRVDAHTHVL